LELVTVDWLRQWCGLPDGAGGLFVSGGSMANLTALAAARHARVGDDASNTVAYCSDQTHSAVERGMLVLGYRADQLRRLPTDERFRLDLTALERAVAEDRASGREPFCVIANAGTTNTGAVDPLLDIAGFCEREEMWLHADAAYGGPAVLCQEGRNLLAGLERSDSIALDPHKWLFQPFEIGCVLLRDRRALRQAFAIRPDYLRDVEGVEEEVNFADYGVQLSRGFRALKLWLSIQVFGVTAFREAIERGLENGRHAEAALRRAGSWDIVAPAQLGVVAFRYASPDDSEETSERVSRSLVDAAQRDGFTLVSSTVLRGNTALRMCTINPRT
jgi:glutamate/tyrosine decarboxylase-like PLP-dependent enzyme